MPTELNTVTVDIRKAQALEGWMMSSELQWLAEQATQHSLIAELGSYLGRSTRALADNTPGVVHAIDHWYGPAGGGNSKPLPPSLDSVSSSGMEWTEEERAALFDQFNKNLEDLIASGKVLPHRIDHTTVDMDIAPDMVFIDGDHSYEAVRHDLAVWVPKVSKGGLICGHDVNQASVHVPVNEVFPNYKRAENTTIWYAYKN